jgi:hypothetical protein
MDDFSKIAIVLFAGYAVYKLISGIRAVHLGLCSKDWPHTVARMVSAKV